MITDLKVKDKIKYIFFALVFSIAVIGVSLVNHFWFLDRSDRTANHNENLIFLVFICAFAVAFFVGYLLNLFVSKNNKAFVVMNAISNGGTIFCVFSAFVILLASYDAFKLNLDYISLFISSSFSLLGFGLTVATIQATFLVRSMKKSNENKRADVILAYILPYILLFSFGLIYTCSALLELQSQHAGYYQIIIFKSLFYSILQLFVLLFRLVGGMIKAVLNGNKNNQNTSKNL